MRPCVRRTFISVLSILTRPEYLYLRRNGNGGYNIINQPARFQPSLETRDIVRLSEEQGRGNAFLNHSPRIAHVEGKADPIRDWDIIHGDSKPKNAEFSERRNPPPRRGLRKRVRNLPGNGIQTKPGQSGAYNQETQRGLRGVPRPF